MRTRQRVLPPFVVQTKDKLFYMCVIVCIGVIIIAFFMNLSSEHYGPRQIFRLSCLLVQITLLLLFRYGYKGIAKIMYSMTAYVITLVLLYSPKHILCGAVMLPCMTMAARGNFLFEGYAERVATLLTLGVDVVALTVYCQFFVPGEGILLTTEVIKKNFTTLIIVIIAGIGIEMYLDSVRMSVYELMKKYDDDVKKATEAKEDFFAAMSHEIRNPLQSLLGSVELLQSSGDRTQQASFVVIIKNCCEVVLDLVSNILDVSKIEAKKLELARVPASLNENINKILRLSLARAQAKGLRLTYVESKPLPPCLLIDPQRLHQVIINLISNAIKFTQKGQIVVDAAWVPLVATEPVEEQVRRQLHDSNWKLFFDPLKEMDDQEVVADKMLRRVHGTHHERRVDEQRTSHSLPQVKLESTVPKEGVLTERNELSRAVKRQMHMARSKPENKEEPFCNHSLREESKSTPLTPGLRAVARHTQDPSARNSEFPAASIKGLVKIEVMDSGIGISKEGIARLFQRYQQADSTISQNYGGTGLGLWISRCIIQQMGGDIRVKSKPGLGTSMIVVFPSETSPEVSVVSDTTVSASVGEEIKGKKCLIVDDIPDNTYILAQLLEGNGLQVVAKNRARDALELFQRSRDIDLVITDLRMPEMSGQTLILEMRRHETEQQKLRTPVIILTGEAALNERVSCLSQYGADDYLLKPIKLQDLMGAVQKALLAKRATKKRRVLVIDDERMSKKLVMTLIKQSGNEAVGCETVAEAKKEIETNYAKYDLILLDNMLPDGTGVDFMKFYTELLAAKRTSSTAVISVSGNTVQDQRVLYAGYPMYGFLQKPVSKSMLLNTIHSIS